MQLISHTIEPVESDFSADRCDDPPYLGDVYDTLFKIIWRESTKVAVGTFLRTWSRVPKFVDVLYDSIISAETYVPNKDKD
jgi:hypothetical protein